MDLKGGIYKYIYIYIYIYDCLIVSSSFLLVFDDVVGGFGEA